MEYIYIYIYFLRVIFVLHILEQILWRKKVDEYKESPNYTLFESNTI